MIVIVEARRIEKRLAMIHKLLLVLKDWHGFSRSLRFESLKKSLSRDLEKNTREKSRRWPDFLVSMAASA